MSSFCVYGYTKGLALARARKNTSTVGDDKAPLPEEAWNQRVAEEAERLFKSARRTKVSNTFDAPQYAEKFIELGEASGELRGGTIYARYESEATAKRKKKTKVMTWKPYKP